MRTFGPLKLSRQNTFRAEESVEESKPISESFKGANSVMHLFSVTVRSPCSKTSLKALSNIIFKGCITDLDESSILRMPFLISATVLVQSNNLVRHT